MKLFSITHPEMPLILIKSKKSAVQVRKDFLNDGFDESTLKVFSRDLTVKALTMEDLLKLLQENEEFQVLYDASF